MPVDETTPLLPDGVGKDKQQHRSFCGSIWQKIHVENRILLAGFLITLSFSFTQVP